MNKIDWDCIRAHAAVTLTQCAHQGWKSRNQITIASFFRITKILCLAYVWLDRRKAQKLFLAFFPEQTLAINSSAKLLFCFVVQLLEEGNTLGCCLSCKICGWTAHFLMKHVCFYRGVPTILLIKAYFSEGLIVVWRMHKQSWLLPQGGRTPHRIHFPLFTAPKIFLTMHHLYSEPEVRYTSVWKIRVEKDCKFLTNDNSY